MKRTGLKLLVLVLTAGLLVINFPAVTVADCADIEATTGNSFQAWSATLWSQTSQAEFEAGIASQVDTATIVGDVILAEDISEVVVASDDLESGDWAGGSGWLWEWWTENSPEVSANGSPHGGSYHIQMASNGDYYYIARPTDMTGMTDVHVRFWAKADSFGASDFVNCAIYDGADDWNYVQTWVDGDDDNTYHYFEFDVSGMDMSDEFYVTFYAELSGAGANFYIDDVQFVATAGQGGIARDYFESGGWNGGTGWLWGWWYQGDAIVTTGGVPYGGSYHCRLSSSTGYIDRAIDLSGCSDVHFKFRAKAESFESGDYAECLIYDGIAWDVVETWIDGEDDGIYHFFDIDLSGYNMHDEFYIAFDAEMGSGDYLYIDHIIVTEPPVYYTSGTLASQVLDTGASGTTWNMLFWDETLPSNTDITFEVRASDTLFAKDASSPSWNAVGGTSPIVSGLPSGRYMQWRATLTTSDTANTPILHEVRLYYYD